MNKIRDGDLYRTVEISGVRFEIRYGYSTEEERKRGWEPSPIYPNFKKRPQYSSDGYPFATAFQDVCEHYAPNPNASKEGWCHDCQYFQKQETHIGLCRCKLRKKHTEE